MNRVWLLLLPIIFTGCQTAPGTGRTQLLMVSNSEVSATAATEFAKMKKIPNDPRLEKVKKIGLAIVTVARKEDKNKILPAANLWEFAIIDDKSPNAFAMPGGKIGFNVGMFPYAPTDDDIAVILGHEVSHVLNQHSNERISQGLLVAAGALIVDEATKNKSAQTRQAWMTGFGLGA
jgi:predicted Zn-dependent protease